MNISAENKKIRLAEIACSKKAMIISGIVCAIPFVFEDLFLLSWIAYVPLALMFFCDRSDKKAFRVFLFGFFYYFVGYSWLSALYPMNFAGFSNAESVGIIVLALTAIPLIHSALFTLSFAVCEKAVSASFPTVKVLVFPLVAVFAEYLQSVGSLAFPWCRVFVSQSASNAVLQSANLFGSYFITYIVLLTNALLAYSIVGNKRKIACAVIALSVFAVNYVYGVARLALYDDARQGFGAVALQGNFSSSAKWSGSTDDMLDVYFELADEALEKLPNGENAIVLMPETGIPVVINESSRYAKRVSAYACDKNITFAVGAFSDKGETSGNSIFLFSSDGEMSEPYSKRHLVPFGERVPYRAFFTAIFPPLAEINMLKYDLYEGNDTVVWNTENGKIGSVICYESVFPSLCRKSVRDGAEILLVATNDSWFGKSEALRHHLAAARMRAIENNVPIIRAANTGISALINPDGSVVSSLGVSQRGYVSGVLYHSGGTTLYTVIGDGWVVLCGAAVCLLAVCRTAFEKKKKYTI